MLGMRPGRGLSQEWCGQGRIRSLATMVARVAMRSLRPKLTPAVSDRTPETHRQAQVPDKTPRPVRHRNRCDDHGLPTQQTGWWELIW